MKMFHLQEEGKEMAETECQQSFRETPKENTHAEDEEEERYYIVKESRNKGYHRSYNHYYTKDDIYISNQGRYYIWSCRN